MAKLKQASLFKEEGELIAIREKERKLEQAHREFVKLPAKLALEKKERDCTMPPMAEIKERQKINRFEQSLSRGQIENVLRTQRHSLAMMMLLATGTLLMLFWAYKIMIG
ncbi:MAG: hypothetical protein IZT59_12485 [Verrucomicrobia bacterium]|jgi:hypothetical protein|nr:hypothetical protein [Verrucomicrobiota bacterium]|tara:strand:- start:2748 stop:3077 length:330 start_codon:yes stop_codon:yes gene_type:complete